MKTPLTELIVKPYPFLKDLNPEEKEFFKTNSNH